MRLRLVPGVLRVPEARRALTPDRIVLVGFMGVGKSTIGRHLAEKLGWAFLDLDAWIQEQQGQPIAQIFAANGEAHFREQERIAAEHAQTLSRHVVAAGGGAFAQAETRAALQKGATTVWLRCDLDAVLGRIAADKATGRPLAADRERMRTLLAGREPHYRLADLIVDTTDTAPDDVAVRIVKELFPGS
jgi:shikimate kinase